MEKKNILEAIKNITSIADIETFEELLFGLKNFNIITYKEYIILLDKLLEYKEQIF
jgi:hypothetical protein